MAELLMLLTSAIKSLADGHLPPIEVIKALISKGLGYGIILGATLVKVPQILNVLRANSAEGLSALSFELEAVGLVIHSSYGYLSDLPFSAYGEAVLLLLQTVVLLGLVYYYHRAPVGRIAAVGAALASGVGFVLAGHINQGMIRAAYEANSLIFVSARLPQIWQNFATKSTGQLSIVTYGLNLAGSMARVFTSIQEGGGSTMVRAFLLSMALNAIIVAQILAYKGAPGVSAPRLSSKIREKKRA